MQCSPTTLEGSQWVSKREASRILVSGRDLFYSWTGELLRTVS
jgi:hypothetical protein